MASNRVTVGAGDRVEQAAMKQAPDKYPDIDLRSAEICVDADPRGIRPVDDGGLAGRRKAAHIRDPEITVQRYQGAPGVHPEGTPGSARRVLAGPKISVDRCQHVCRAGCNFHAAPTVAQQVPEVVQGQPFKDELASRVVEGYHPRHHEQPGLLSQRSPGQRAEPFPSTGAGVLKL